jgi:hypothetical protein
MRLESERSFGAGSPVGRYWLLNCVGFHVEGGWGRKGTVEEVGLGPEGVEVLAVRRRRVVGRRLVLVPAERVESIHPWEDTIVLASRRWHARDRRAAQAHHTVRRLRSVGGAAAAESGRAVRDGSIVVFQVLSAFAALLVRLTVLAREQMPGARRRISETAATLKLIARTYAIEARRAWRAEKEAIAMWREAIAMWQESRRAPAQEPGDDEQLTRAGADTADTRWREMIRR